ncbi:MAG: DUF1552 domain-containing protein [Vicinamibacterales bacterium]
MVITKLALPRRTFLRGIGASLALPLLDAMIPALTALAKTQANPGRRIGFVYVPNGVAMNATVNYWKPKTVGPLTELSPVLSPLTAFRQQLIVVSGLAHAQAEAMGDGQGDHSRASAAWLSGVHAKQTEGADVRAARTLDQLAAEVLGKETQLGSLELSVDPNFLVGNCENGYSCVYINTLSWRSATTPLPTENNPRVVFERLFGDGGTPAQRRAQARRNRSILDSVTEDVQRLERSLGSGDRTRLSEYLEAVREVETRIQRAEARIDDASLPTLERPVGIPDSFGEHLGLMYDLQWLAYRADVTRVSTLMLGRELVGRAYPELGVPESHHGLSHHRDDSQNLEKLAKINTYHIDLFSKFLEKLQSTPEGDGTLLDSTVLLYGAGLSNPNEHAHTDLPLMLVGGAGGLKGGRHLQFPKGTPMMNLLLSMLDRVGLPVEQYGDSTGRLDLEPLAGL